MPPTTSTTMAATAMASTFLLRVRVMLELFAVLGGVFVGALSMTRFRTGSSASCAAVLDGLGSGRLLERRRGHVGGIPLPVRERVDVGVVGMGVVVGGDVGCGVVVGIAHGSPFTAAVHHVHRSNARGLFRKRFG